MTNNSHSTGRHTETHCHCGADRRGSDHCPECFCEEFEGTCDHEHSDDEESDIDLRACAVLIALDGHNDPTTGMGFRLLWDRGLITLDEMEAAAAEWEV